jgi:hypothetical protein
MGSARGIVAFSDALAAVVRSPRLGGQESEEEGRQARVIRSSFESVQ